MVYLVFGLFLVLTIYTVVKKYWLISTYICGVYTFMMLFAIILANVSQRDAEYSYSRIFSSSIFAILLTFCFLPFFKHKPVFVHDDSEEFAKRFSKVGYITSLLIIMGMILLIPAVLQSIASGLGSIRRAMYLDESTNVSYGMFGNIGQGILRRTSWIGYINLLMFFYAMVYIKRHIILKTLLVISSLSPVWLGILNGGRTYTIYWLLFLVFCIAIFYKEFTFKNKRQIFALMIVFILFVLRYFVLATNERILVSSTHSSSNEFLISYTGQSFSNFNYYFDRVDWHPYTFQRELPLLTSFLFGRLNMDSYRSLIYTHTGILVNGFSTFLGTIYVDTGIVGMIVYTIVFCLIARRIMKNREFDLTHLIYLGIIAQIPLMGVFYYSYYRSEISIQIIVMILLARYMDLDKIPVRIKLLNNTSLEI